MSLGIIREHVRYYSLQKLRPEKCYSLLKVAECAPTVMYEATISEPALFLIRVGNSYKEPIIGGDVYFVKKLATILELARKDFQIKTSKKPNSEESVSSAVSPAIMFEHARRFFQNKIESTNLE